MLYAVSCPKECPIQHQLGLIVTKNPVEGSVITMQPKDWNFVGMLNMGLLAGAHKGKSVRLVVEAVERLDFSVDGAFMALRTRLHDDVRLEMTSFHADLVAGTLPEATLHYAICGCDNHFMTPTALPPCPFCGNTGLFEPELTEWFTRCSGCGATYWWSQASQGEGNAAKDEAVMHEWAAWQKLTLGEVRDAKLLATLFGGYTKTNRVTISQNWMFVQPS